MNDRFRLLSLPALALPFLLSGCAMISTHRKLPVPIAPAVVQTATPEQLVARLNEGWDNLQTLTVRVQLQLSVVQSSIGRATDYTSIPGIILLRKPSMLRVYGQVPVIGTRALDMVSDGKNFKLWIPSKSKVFEGSNKLHEKSANLIENIRPDFFFDALAVRGVDPEDDYGVAADSETLEDASKKHLLFTPEYNLTIMQPKPGTREFKPLRVVTFHREDLLPYEQDLYDDQGNLETHVSYANYQSFGGDKYPSTITIKRPNEGFQIVLTVQSVKENQPLKDETFQLEIPAGTQVQNLH